MRAWILPSLTLALGLALLVTGCRGSMEIATLGDDDSAVDDDDVTDDDDLAPDDDDDGTDDDDIGPDDDDVDPPDGILGYFYLQGTVQHPQGRFADGYGYYYLYDGRDMSDVPAPPLVDPSGARGADFGCEIDLPDSDEERGGDIPTYDAGLWAQLSTVSDAGDVWTHTMERYDDDGFIYYLSAQSGNPPAVPPGLLLDFEVPGGAEIPAITMPGTFPTHAPFGLSAPVLDPGQDMLTVDRTDGLTFTWEPANEEGVEIVLAFFEDDLVWSVNCWLEDTGSFTMGTELVESMPSGITGLVWFRRYVSAWHPENLDHPDTYFTGALQHRWFAVMGPEGDAGDEG